MVNVSGILKLLIEERDRLNTAIAALQGVSGGASRGRRKGTMSAAGKARSAAAQRARWAKIRRSKKKAA
jgi:hypothetical protein